MTRSKRILSLVIAMIMCIGMIPMTGIAATETAGFDNFAVQNTVESDTFTDFTEDDWFYNDVKAVYELGLMVGKGEGTFAPDSSVTLAEAITIAARLNSTYTTGADEFEVSDPWYKSYADYAIENGILTFEVADYNAPAKRAEFALIMANALPEEALEAINTVTDGAIPDVAADAEYAEAVYALYRAGIMIGNDEAGTFAPDSEIKRSEVAAITARMADAELRKEVTLGEEETTEAEDTSTEPEETTAEADETTEPEETTAESEDTTDAEDTTAPEDTTAESEETTAPEEDEAEEAARKRKMRELFLAIIGFQMGKEDQKTYTVAFNSNGGTAVASQYVSEGGLAVKPEDPINPGFLLEGWYVDEELNFKFNFATPIVSDLTLHANWIPSGSAYQVTFMLNNGSNGSYQMQLVPAGETATRPVDPEMDLHRFVNWYTEPEGLNEFDFSTPITTNTFVYAAWGAPDGDDSTLYSANSGGGTDFAIAGLEMTGSNLTATINTNTSAFLVVSFYEDDGTFFTGDFENDPNAPALITTVSARTPEYCELVPVIIPVTETLPEHYYIVAELCDEHGNALCSPLVNNENTAVYEVYDSKTVADFDEELVLMYTGELDDNFAVLNEDVKHITSTDTVNTLEVEYIPVPVVDEDDVAGVDDKVYHFTNPDAALLALQVGDVVIIDDTSYLFKIASITEENGEIIMTESSDVEITDFYQFIKIDMDIQNPDAEPASQSDFSLDGDVVDASTSFEIARTINWTPKDWLEIGGGFTVTGTLRIKVVYDIKVFARDYIAIEFTADAQVKLDGHVEVSIDNSDSVAAGSDKIEIEFFKVGIPTPIAGLTIEIKPSVPIELEAKAGLTFEATSKITAGFKYSNYDGKQNINKKESSLKLYLQGEASAKIGPKLKISLAFCKSVLEVGLNAGAGVKFTAKTNEITIGEITNAEEKHACGLCIEGTAKWYAEVYVDVTYCVIKDILEGDLGKWYIVQFEGDFPISPNFYFSVINAEDSYFEGSPKFGWGTCPNTSYRTDIIVKDENGQEIRGIDVYVEHDRTGRSNSGDSPYRTYLYKGSYTATASIDGNYVSKSITVSDSAQTVVLTAESNDGTAYGSVVDATTGSPISGASVVVSQNGVNIDSAVTAADGSFSVELADGTYLITTTKSGYQTFQDYVTVSNATTTYLQVTRLVPEEDDSARGGFAGRIVDGVTGYPINNVRLEIRYGWNNPGTGDIIDVIYTDSDGDFRFALRNFLGLPVGLRPGEYTLIATKDGYMTTSHNITVVANEERGGQGFSMSPVLGENQCRIRLEWGASPRDLDSHLVAPLVGGGTYHLYFPEAEENGGNPHDDYFILDLDDTSSYGPETTTIKQAIPGKYYFYVYNWSGESDMRYSDARVIVDFNDRTYTFNIPLDQGSGRYWNVFVLDTVAGTITPTNTITDAPSAFSLDSLGSTSVDDEILAMIDEDIRNTPKN